MLYPAFVITFDFCSLFLFLLPLLTWDIALVEGKKSSDDGGEPGFGREDLRVPVRVLIVLVVSCCVCGGLRGLSNACGGQQQQRRQIQAMGADVEENKVQIAGSSIAPIQKLVRVALTRTKQDQPLGIGIGEERKRGTVVTSIQPDSPASTSLLEPGMILKSVNGIDLQGNSARTVAAILGQQPPGLVWILAEVHPVMNTTKGAGFLDQKKPLPCTVHARPARPPNVNKATDENAPNAREETGKATTGTALSSGIKKEDENKDTNVASNMEEMAKDDIEKCAVMVSDNKEDIDLDAKDYC